MFRDREAGFSPCSLHSLLFLFVFCFLTFGDIVFAAPLKFGNSSIISSVPIPTAPVEQALPTTSTLDVTELANSQEKAVLIVTAIETVYQTVPDIATVTRTLRAEDPVGAGVPTTVLSTHVFVSMITETATVISFTTVADGIQTAETSTLQTSLESTTSTLSLETSASTTALPVSTSVSSSPTPEEPLVSTLPLISTTTFQLPITTPPAVESPTPEEPTKSFFPTTFSGELASSLIISLTDIPDTPLTTTTEPSPTSSPSSSTTTKSIIVVTDVLSGGIISAKATPSPLSTSNSPGRDKVADFTAQVSSSSTTSSSTGVPMPVTLIGISSSVRLSFSLIVISFVGVVISI